MIRLLFSPAHRPPRRPAPGRWGTRATVLLGLLVLLGTVAPPTASAARAAAPPAAPAANSVGEVASALRDDPVYVDPRERHRVSSATADDLRQRIRDADRPLFVAVLPAEPAFPPDTLLSDLRAQTGISGVYAVALGDDFDAGADRQVLSRQAVSGLSGAAEREHGDDTTSLLRAFVDRALPQTEGQAPDSWSGGASDGRTTGGTGALWTLAALVVLALSATLLFRLRGRQRRAARERAELERLRPVVDEDITAFGDELRRVDFDPSAPDSDEETREDYSRALDAYERAKRNLAEAAGPQDVRPVTEAVEDGRFALTVLEARRAGEPLPDRRPPCFFDPRHGPSVADVSWAPPDGVAREVPVCAADRTRLAEGREPLARTVDTPAGPRPYWEAGPLYGPWAGGYFGGALLPGLLVGTMLGGVLSGPGYGYAWGDGGVPGGDATGADFDPGDFGGGFGDGGFGGGGDFGGGGF